MQEKQATIRLFVTPYGILNKKTGYRLKLHNENGSL